MPWINQEMCTGCCLCINECPVDVIAMSTDRFAVIDESECIRCGRCHDVCPQKAVRHDSERIAQEVAENLQWVRKLMGHFQEPEEQSAFMERMVRFFKKQQKVSQQTLEAIAQAKDAPAKGMDVAIRDLLDNRVTDASKG